MTKHFVILIIPCFNYDRPGIRHDDVLLFFVSVFFVLGEVWFGDLFRFVEFVGTVFQSDSLPDKSEGLISPV